MAIEMGNNRVRFGPANEAELYRDTTSGSLFSTAGMHIYRPDSTSAGYWVTNSTGTGKVDVTGDGIYFAAPGQSSRLWLRGTSVYCGGNFLPDDTTGNRDIGSTTALWNAAYVKGNINTQGNIIHTGSNMSIWTQGSVVFRLDSDDNAAAEFFQLQNGQGREVFRVTEQGIFSFRRNDAGTAGEVNLYIYGASRSFRFYTLSTNLLLTTIEDGEIVRFNFSGTRFTKDLKPLYTWDSTTSPANLGSTTEVWHTAYVRNVATHDVAITGKLHSLTDVIVQVDSDNNGSNSFIVQNGAGTGIFSVNESGDMTLQGSITAAAMSLMGNLTTLHVLPNSTNNYDLGSDSYRYRSVIAGTANFSGSVTAAGLITGSITSPSPAGDIAISATQDVNVRVDSDNNGSNSFNVKNGANTTVFSVNESGVTAGAAIVGTGVYDMNTTSGTVSINVAGISRILLTPVGDITGAITVTGFTGATEGQIVTVISRGGTTTSNRYVTFSTATYWPKINTQWDTRYDTAAVMTLTLQYSGGEWRELAGWRKLI